MVEWWGVVATAVALVLQHHHVSVTANIKSYTLKRFWLSSSTAALTRCPPKKIEVPVKIQLPRLFCTVACTSDPNCKFFSLVGRTCHIQTLSLSPGYDVPGSDLQSYIILDGSPRDYATNMPVQAGSIFPGYPDPATLTDGTFCWTDPLQCSCTEPTNQWFTIDLQETRTIARSSSPPLSCTTCPTSMTHPFMWAPPAVTRQIPLWLPRTQFCPFKTSRSSPTMYLPRGATLRCARRAQ
ncbi:uncharacterized protein [Panulirus ornatus]|uniref:uncharacterized protein n=1 Tax=Panulirus ornatus TaxID=150431 RepID=UPI003A86399E